MVEPIEIIKLALNILSLISTIAVFVYVRADNQQRATKKSITDTEDVLRKLISKESDRIGALEIEIGKLPSRTEYDLERERSRQEIIRIHERIDEINVGIKDSQLMLGELIGYTKRGNHG